MIIIIYYIDDLIITRPNKDKIDEITNKISKQIKLEYLGLINQFLRMEINLDYKNKSMLIHQTKYLQNLKTRFNKDKLNLVSTLIDLGTQLHKSDTKANKEELKLY